jgi:broad specificity phosphatase PhoE
MNIYFVRHGQTDHNKGLIFDDTNIRLNAVGLRQADLVAKRLKNYNIQRIYTSNLTRTMQTAVAISTHTGAPLIVDSNLREIDLGDWASVDPETDQITHREYFEEWSNHLTDMPYPGGECGADVVKRTRGLLNNLFDLELDDVAVVTHGGVIRILFSSFLQLGLEKRFSIDVENCSISVITYNKLSKNYRINRINDMAHLEENM